MKKINISTKKYPNTFVLVDNEDFNYLNQWKWHPVKIKNRFAVKRCNKGKNLYIHVEIMKPPKGMVVDHIFHNGLDNRRSKLRICSYSQNTINTKYVKGKSKFKGVVLKTDIKRNKPWYSHIYLNNKNIFIGYFKTEIEAAKAYNKKAKEIHGEFAYENRI